MLVAFYSVLSPFSGALANPLSGRAKEWHAQRQLRSSRARRDSPRVAESVTRISAFKVMGDLYSAQKEWEEGNFAKRKAGTRPSHPLPKFLVAASSNVAG